LIISGALPISSNKPNEQSAEELMVRVARRDAAALGELFDRYAPQLLGLLAEILPNRATAEQTLQGLFLSIWTEATLSRPAPSQSVGAWLLIRGRLAGIGRLRSERGLPPPPEACVETVLKYRTWLPQPDMIELIDGRTEMLRKVLRQLPRHQREVLDYVVHEGCSEPEIAQRLGEPLARMRAELSAGLTFFRHRLRAVLGTWTANI
jgi:RNA polymerase sigma-70 factor (ECF subfamily)